MTPISLRAGYNYVNKLTVNNSYLLIQLTHNINILSPPLHTQTVPSSSGCSSSINSEF